MIYKLIVILAVFAAACAQMLLKKGAQIPSPLGEGLGVKLLKQYFNGWVIVGYAIMFVSMLINIWAMSKGVMVKEVSIIESLSYLFVPMLSYLLFRESITKQQVCAIILIIGGILIFFI